MTVKEIYGTDFPVILAPMAGITDLPFRILCKEQGADVMVTEMISAKALFYGNKNTLPLMQTEEEEKPIGVQIFGPEPELMGAMAHKIENKGFSYIDINMGCPVPKIVNNKEGSALMLNPELAGRIVKEVSKAVSLPVTVKFRKGFDDDCINATEIAKIAEANGASAIWSNVIKYVGAGAIATGGVISLLKSLPLIIKTFAGAMKSLKNTSGGTNVRTDRDMKMPVVLGIILIVIILIWLVPSVPVSLLGAFLIAIFGFFFATVSSRMVGLIGSSNNPVSGMAIATLLISTFVLKATGNTGMAGMTGAIAIGSIICVIAAIAGDTSQDLKTGFIVGATPAKQQVGELIGVVASGFAIAGVMSLLNKAWGFGSAEIPAPQATLMKMIVEGIMDAKLPWVLVFMGVFLALALEVLRVPVMPFAIGLYLPIYLSCGIMVGGVVRLFLDKKKEAEAKKKEMISNGTLYCAGMIAGEGLVGILMAVLAIIKVGDNSIAAIIGGLFNLSGAAGNIVGLIVLALMILSLLKFSVWSKTKSK